MTFTLCVTSGPHSYAAVEWIVGAPGAAQAQPWGGAPTIQLGPFDPALVLDLAPVVFLAPPATAAPGASAGAVSIGILSSHVRGPPDFTAATNSLLVVATPQLADADVAVFVSLDSSPPPVCDVGAGGSSEVICSGWTWAFSTAAGGGALLIDALDPCTLSSLATLNGPPPAINTTACDAGNFMAAGSVWVLVVPLFAGGFPPPGSQARAAPNASCVCPLTLGDDSLVLFCSRLLARPPGCSPRTLLRAQCRPSSQRCVNLGVSSFSEPVYVSRPFSQGFMPSAPLQLRDGSVVQSITSPYLMCPIRTSLGSCDGDPSTWVEASASVYAYADAAQQSYSPGTVTTLQVDRLCDSDPLSDGPGVGPCGPPLSVYLLSFPGGLPRVYGPPFATWPDAFDATSSFHFRPEDSSFVLHFDTPAGCCT